MLDPALRDTSQLSKPFACTVSVKYYHMRVRHLSNHQVQVMHAAAHAGYAVQYSLVPFNDCSLMLAQP